MVKTPYEKFHLFVLLVCCFGSVGSTRCEDGWELNRGNCYFFSTEHTTGYRAQQQCAAKNASLADVQNGEENSFITDKIGSRAHWISLRKQPSAWYWDGDGISLSQDSYSNWMPREPNNAGGNDHCAVIRTCGRWIDVPCSQSRKFVCKSIKVAGNCGSNWREHQGYCYFFSRQQTTLEGAKQQCTSMSAFLVDIFSSEENSFVRANLHPASVQGYSWMGLRRRSARWVWNEQAAEIGYSRWDSGEPNGRRGYSCAEIEAGGRWTAKPCSYVRLRYVCKTNAGEECETETFPFGPCSTTCGDGTKSRLSICMRGTIPQYNRETVRCENQPACDQEQDNPLP